MFLQIYFAPVHPKLLFLKLQKCQKPSFFVYQENPSLSSTGGIMCFSESAEDFQGFDSRP